MVSLNKNDLPDKLQAVYLEGHFYVYVDYQNKCQKYELNEEYV